VKIGPVDPEIALLKGSLKKKEMNANGTYSPRGIHAARAKNNCSPLLAQGLLDRSLLYFYKMKINHCQ